MKNTFFIVLMSFFFGSLYAQKAQTKEIKPIFFTNHKQEAIRQLSIQVLGTFAEKLNHYIANSNIAYDTTDIQKVVVRKALIEILRVKDRNSIVRTDFDWNTAESSANRPETIYPNYFDALRADKRNHEKNDGEVYDTYHWRVKFDDFKFIGILEHERKKYGEKYFALFELKQYFQGVNQKTNPIQRYALLSIREDSVNNQVQLNIKLAFLGLRYIQGKRRDLDLKNEYKPVAIAQRHFIRNKKNKYPSYDPKKHSITAHWKDLVHSFAWQNSNKDSLAFIKKDSLPMKSIDKNIKKGVPILSSFMEYYIDTLAPLSYRYLPLERPKSKTKERKMIVWIGNEFLEKTWADSGVYINNIRLVFVSANKNAETFLLTSLKDSLLISKERTSKTDTVFRLHKETRLTLNLNDSIFIRKAKAKGFIRISFIEKKQNFSVPQLTDAYVRFFNQVAPNIDDTTKIDDGKITIKVKTGKSGTYSLISQSKAEPLLYAQDIVSIPFNTVVEPYIKIQGISPDNTEITEGDSITISFRVEGLQGLRIDFHEQENAKNGFATLGNSIDIDGHDILLKEHKFAVRFPKSGKKLKTITGYIYLRASDGNAGKQDMWKIAITIKRKDIKNKKETKECWLLALFGKK